MKFIYYSFNRPLSYVWARRADGSRFEYGSIADKRPYAEFPAHSALVLDVQLDSETIRTLELTPHMDRFLIDQNAERMRAAEIDRLTAEGLDAETITEVIRQGLVGRTGQVTRAIAASEEKHGEARVQLLSRWLSEHASALIGAENVGRAEVIPEWIVADLSL